MTTSTGPVRRTQAGVLLAAGADGRLYGWPEWDGTDTDDPNARALGFDPATGEWADVAGTALALWECPAGATPAGRFVYVRDCAGTAAWFDTATQTYRSAGDPKGLPDTDGVWTGTELLLWGIPPCDTCTEAPPLAFTSLTPPGG